MIDSYWFKMRTVLTCKQLKSACRRELCLLGLMLPSKTIFGQIAQKTRYTKTRSKYFKGRSKIPPGYFSPMNVAEKSASTTTLTNINFPH